MESWLWRLSVLVLLISISCGSHVVGDVESDKRALLAFRAVVGRFVKWDAKASSPCNWVGVTCMGNRVTEVRLPRVGIMVQIPSGTLGNLTQLRILSLRWNMLSGPLPSDLANCLHMRNLYVQNNQLSGPIPSFISSWPNMVRLNLAFNKISVPIPSSLNTTKRLGTLYLENNSLTGSIPSLNLPVLVQFNVSDNKLNGPVPSTLKAFSKDCFLGNSLCGSPLPACASSLAPALSPSRSDESGHKGKTSSSQKD